MLLNLQSGLVTSSGAASAAKPGVNIATASGLITSSGFCSVTDGTPLGAMDDFAMFDIVDPDPAMIITANSNDGAQTGANGAAWARNFMIVTPPENYKVSDGYAWKRGAFASLGFKFSALDAGNHQYLSNVQFEELPTSYTAPLAFDSPRSVNSLIHPDRVNFATNPSFENDAMGWSPVGAGTISRDMSFYHSGVASGKITTNTKTGTGAGHACSRLVPGKTYIASAWVMPGGLVGSATRTNLVTNPSMEAASGTIVTRTNLFPNPTVPIDTTSWLANAGTGGVTSFAQQTAQTGWGIGVTTSARATWTTATTAVSGGIGLAVTAAGSTPAGKTFAFSMQTRCSKAQTLHAVISWYDVNGVLLSSTTSASTAVAANTVVDIGVTGLAPTSADHASCYIEATGTGTVWAINDWLEATWGSIEETSVLTTAAGGGGALGGTVAGFLGAGSYGADFTYSWAGTANASASQQLAPALVNVGSSSAAVSRSTDRFYNRKYSERVVFGTGSAATNLTGLLGTSLSMAGSLLPGYVAGLGPSDYILLSGLVVGQVYTHSRYVYVPTGSPDVLLSVDSIGVSAAMSTKDSWVRMTHTITATANIHAFRIVPVVDTVRGSALCYTDSAQIETGSVATPYFDGATPTSEPYLFNWTSTPDASTSITGLALEDATITIAGRNAVITSGRFATSTIQEGRWRRIWATFQALTSTETIQVTSPDNVIFWVDDVLLEQSEHLHPYFDGGSGGDYLWESGGTPGSTRSYYYQQRLVRSALIRQLLDENMPVGIYANDPQYAVPFNL